MATTTETAQITNIIDMEKARNDRYAKGPRIALLVGMWSDGDRSPEALGDAAALARENGAESDAEDLEWLAEYQAGGSPPWSKDEQAALKERAELN